MHIINKENDIMYEMIIKEYLNKLTIYDIDNFATKNNIILKYGENKIIYDFIKQRWKDIYNGNTLDAFNYLKKNISKETYDFIIKLYNEFIKKVK